MNKIPEIPFAELKINSWNPISTGFVTRQSTHVSITHVATRLHVEASDERSIHKARADAMKKFGKAWAEYWSNPTRDAREASQAQPPAFPPRDLTKPAEQQGMFSKFHVERVDGSSAKGGKHHGCRYWVLDLDHDKHAPAAMRGYAEDCKETHPILSAEIFAEFGRQSQAQQESSLIDLMAKHGICVEFSQDQMIVMAYWCGNPDRIFRQYNRGNLAEAIKTCVTAVASALPPAPEGDKS